MSTTRDKYSSAFNAFTLGVEVQCDSAAEISSEFTDGCFKDKSIDREVSDLLEIFRSDIESFTPSTNYIALGRDISKLLKKCNEFPDTFERFKKERDERLTIVKGAIEEERKALDQQFRNRAQEMKKDCQNRLQQLEISSPIYICL